MTNSNSNKNETTFYFKTGESFEGDILFTYSYQPPDFDKEQHYVVYTDYSCDEDNITQIFAGIIRMEISENHIVIEDIDSELEWEVVKLALEYAKEEVRNKNSPSLPMKK